MILATSRGPSSPSAYLGATPLGSRRSQGLERMNWHRSGFGGAWANSGVPGVPPQIGKTGREIYWISKSAAFLDDGLGYLFVFF